MAGTMSRPINEIYDDVQALLKDVAMLSGSYKNIYMRAAPPVGLTEIEAAMQLIQRDLIALQQCNFTHLQYMINDSDCEQNRHPMRFNC